MSWWTQCHVDVLLMPQSTSHPVAMVATGHKKKKTGKKAAKKKAAAEGKVSSLSMCNGEHALLACGK